MTDVSPDYETCPFDRLRRRHEQAEVALHCAVQNDRDVAFVRRLEAIERAYRRERVRRAYNRRP